MKNRIIIIVLSVLCLSPAVGCSDFLEEKSDSRLVTPETLEDNQALLDRISNLLGGNSISAEISSDDLYITDSDYNGISYEPDKRLYTWQPNLVSRSSGNDWESCFYRINICNTVLNNLQQYHIGNSGNVEGQARAIRAAIYLEAAQIWCLAYNKSSAGNDLGLPLRLDPDVNQPSVRSSLSQTYDQILTDLHMAVSLLPDKQVSVTRASKATALGLLARTYLYMGDYANALQYADQALEIDGELLDFNSLNSSDSYPIKEMNVEVLLPTTIAYSPILSGNNAKIAQSFYDSYDNNDLRKSIFFRMNSSGMILFKGNYSGTSQRSSVLAKDELYLIAAESAAQLNDLDKAMERLNGLLVKRWKSGTFTDFTASDKATALELIRNERRKELLLRGLRWADLKRYNRDGTNISLSRTVAGQTYTLVPNDLRYAIAIPEDIIKQTGMPQNPR
ncbi:RagB/SusD family nutrient uptake outer membrane protein [Chryseobacterium cucumeris]|uniref:RagB/SusD family nutrient uptake outer membrane protein n=1 Tax=Chryseobacterium cucumeris TaxID=1813611 RepID=UPI00245416CF|nr:RagB/SusD family nutrient uptake outer membrane protein [Chryseobacterium cucumeris]MDH5034001.1 RagB/SusD family nutrient uptake outer membrane protein [Chryseobacterium cucumeris]